MCKGDQQEEVFFLPKILKYRVLQQASRKKNIQDNNEMLTFKP
jgi:hypothetical protein